ncbi:hypothetical protein [Dysgonomonas gadei]|uniref:Uncharacterized protein n=1 Tax=Dysgonomonas gadei ATCC BAA-286 TaxID=742766 RepID=F5ITS4_9BACT|nr:hypothetical protein [Dysgonomonas gadei]EGJ99458.1 hypothetical protein HMPREF9455_00491 [Dysgonomonas gadei ATCC BAA-286]
MAKKTINIDIEINTKKAEEAVSKFGKFLGVEDTLIANFYKHSGNVIDPCYRAIVSRGNI